MNADFDTLPPVVAYQFTEYPQRGGFVVHTTPSLQSALEARQALRNGAQGASGGSTFSGVVEVRK